MPEQIIQKELSEVMGSSYLDYALSVIVSRALPDVRDGLKPVHRRIIYSMHGLGLDYNKGFRKSAKTVGDVLGRTHPHGDGSVYEALVRMAQDFSLRYPLVHGQGNFGSLDGEKAAAYRYTEAKLTRLGSLMIKDIDKDTVDFRPNFDDKDIEPEVLPGLFPNLLANGSSGIAVGMATNMAPHNITDIYNACLKTIESNLEGEDLSLQEVARIIQAPDFPTGGLICNPQETLEAIMTGYGKVITRAKHTIEETKNSINIVYTEIPYMVNKADLVEKINDCKELINGMREVRDESNKEGIRIVVELRKKCNVNLAINTLFKKTRLQTNFTINNTCIVDNQPRVLNVKELVDYFLAHVATVISRRTQYELDKAQKRLHLVEGFIKALEDIKRVIEIIESSETDEIANDLLIEEFGFSDEQTKAIMDMRLRALSNQSAKKLSDERDSLNALVEKYTSILEDNTSLLNQMHLELSEYKTLLSDERRTEICYDSDTSIKDEDLIEEETLVLVYTKNGSIKAIKEKEFKTQARNGKGTKAQNLSEDDAIIYMKSVNSKDDLLFLTNKGRMHKLKVYDIDVSSRTSKGKHVANYLELSDEENIITMVATRLSEQDKFLMMCTKKGTTKKLEFSKLITTRKSIPIITIVDGDELLDAIVVEEDDEVAYISSDGNIVRINSNQIRAIGRAGRGVKAMTLNENCTISDFIKLEKDEESILTVAENGLARKIKISSVKTQTRGLKGLIFYREDNKKAKAIDSMSVKESDEVLIVTEQNQIVRFKVSEISEVGSRYASGVKAINLAEGDRVISATKVKIEDDKEEEI